MVCANRVALFYITRRGRTLAERIARHYPGAACARLSGPALETHWVKGARLIFIMAAGIVVRKIAPLLKDKRTDPAAVVLDEHGEHVVSLLSGHLGGANALAKEVASFVHGTPVITTASDSSGLPSIDLWAGQQGLAIEDWKQLPRVATRLLDRGSLRLYTEIPVDAPAPLLRTEEAAAADLVITNRSLQALKGLKKHAFLLRPGNLVAGVGCNSNTGEAEIEDAVKRTFIDAGLSFLSLRAIATIDKKGSEPGLRAFAKNHALPLVLFTPDELNRIPGVSPSEAARKATGANAVAEPSAILGTAGGRLLAGKRRMGNVTVAIAEDLSRKGGGEQQASGPGGGMIYVVGTGPGSADDLTPRALKAIQESDVIVGYGPYLDLIRGLTHGKEIVSTGMAQEIDRCERAIQLSREGRCVSVVSGGDPGIYAMAGLVLELMHKGRETAPANPPVRIIPGISALNACAARLGAPLMHDFATISLSDRLTPWETIARRLDAAARADFVVVLYNPRSKGRPTHISRAQKIILKHRAPGTPVGIVRSATREQEKVLITDLGNLPFDEIDMQTTVIIGNSRSVVRDNLMITPRGYENKGSW